MQHFITYNHMKQNKNEWQGVCGLFKHGITYCFTQGLQVQ